MIMLLLEVIFILKFYKKKLRTPKFQLTKLSESEIVNKYKIVAISLKDEPSSIKLASYTSQIT